MNLAMTTIVLQFMLEGPRPCTILCFNVHTTVEYLNRNVFVGKLLQHIFKTYCGLFTVKVQNANKDIKQRSLSGFTTIAFH